MTVLEEIEDFLPCKTPEKWLENAVENPELLLIDHANCEKKAASTALNLIYRYVDNYDLLNKMSRLAREEMRHFEQVLNILNARNITFRPLAPARYGKSLHLQIRPNMPHKCVDQLIIAALIEARSCERFHALIPYLDDQLASFYNKLYQAESRHFSMYLEMAYYFENDIDTRISEIVAFEADILQQSENVIRFHSGIPKT